MKRAAMLLVLCLSACGFHLQGRMPLPESIRRIHIETVDAQSDFVQALREGLVASGAQLTDLPGPAAATLQVSRDRVTERVLTVDRKSVV